MVVPEKTARRKDGDGVNRNYKLLLKQANEQLFSGRSFSARGLKEI
jgi:hypothetical protein